MLPTPQSRNRIDGRVRSFPAIRRSIQVVPKFYKKNKEAYVGINSIRYDTLFSCIYIYITSQRNCRYYFEMGGVGTYRTTLNKHTTTKIQNHRKKVPL